MAQQQQSLQPATVKADRPAVLPEFMLRPVFKNPQCRGSGKCHVRSLPYRQRLERQAHQQRLRVVAGGVSLALGHASYIATSAAFPCW